MISAAYDELFDTVIEIEERLDRLEALEAEREPPPKPEPEKGWVIFLKGPYGGHWCYDRLDGFIVMPPGRIWHPALFGTKADAESVIKALDLRGLGYVQSMDGRVYVGPSSDLTDPKP